MSDAGESGVLDSGEVYLIELYPLDVSVSPPDVTGVFLATQDATFPGDIDAPAVEYDGRVIQALAYRRDLWRDGLIGGGSLPAQGAITIAVDDVLVDVGTVAAWRSYAWGGRQIRVLRGMVGDAYSTYEVLLDGLLSGVNTFGIDEISIGLSDLTVRLTRPVHTETYLGTGGFEGGADLKGASKPWGFGMFRAAEPQPIADPADLWFDVDLNGFDDSVVPLVEDGGVAYTDTASNPPGSGQVFVDYANGRVRLGTAPTQTLTVTAKSAFGGEGSPLIGVTTAADIIETLLIGNMGFVSSELDTAAFAALNSADNSTLGGWYPDPPSAMDVLDAAMNSVGGYYTTQRGGKLTVGIWSAPTATAETDGVIALVITDEDLVRGTARIEPIASPPNRIEVGWGRAHTVLGPDNFNGSATEARREFLSQAYRYAIDDSPNVEAEHLLSAPLITETLIDEVADAEALAALRKGLFAVGGREAFVGRLQLRPFSIEPAAEIWVRSELLDVDAAFRITTLGDNARDPLVEIRAWR